MGSGDTGIFPSQCVQKKWPRPTSGLGPTSKNFRDFSSFPQNVRENIYHHFFDFRPDAAIRAIRPFEHDIIKASKKASNVGSLVYRDSSLKQRVTRLLDRSAIFAMHRLVTVEIARWLTRTYTIHAITYEIDGWARKAEDYDSELYYPPLAFRQTLPAVGQFADVVTRLEIDIMFLLDIPRFLAKYLDGVNVGSLRVTFRALDKSSVGQGYYRQFAAVVRELELLEAKQHWWMMGVCVEKEVEFVWVEMEETFGGYPAADREQYCGGYLGPVRAVCDRLNQNWIERFAPERLMEGVTFG